MRTIVRVAIALAGMSLTSTFADAGTWCATYRLGKRVGVRPAERQS